MLKRQKNRANSGETKQRSVPRERREWAREFANDEEITISFSRSAKVLDESPAGLGLLMADVGDLRINEPVEIYDQDGVSRLSGRIANLHRTESGQWRVGIELKSYHLPGVYFDSFKGAVQSFVDSLLADSPPPVTAMDGYRVALVVDAAYESARTGRTVHIGQA